MTGIVVDLTALPLPHAVPAGVIAADAPVFNGPCRLYGWSLTEATGAAVAAINLRDGGDTNSPKISLVTLLANESRVDWLSATGLWCKTGVFADIVTGSVDVTLYVVRL